MEKPSPKKIFLSHDTRDKNLADALKGLLKGIFRSGVAIEYSSDEGGGPRPGTFWREWIEERVRDSQKTFVILTETSKDTPWVLWEAGAVTGASLSREAGSSDEAGEALSREHVVVLDYQATL